MKYLYYIKYFFFISWNWNIRLALFTLYHEIKGEKKYGIHTSRSNDLQKLTVKGNRSNAEPYQGANYYLLEKLLNEMKEINANNNLVDFGCGKGRVMAVSAWYPFHKITGIEFASELCAEARINISPIQQKFPGKIFNVLNLNAEDFIPAMDDNVFFFFNPFNEIVMTRVVKNILGSLKQYPREVFVIYINAMHEEIFLSAGFERIFHYEKYIYIQGCIYMRRIR